MTPARRMTICVMVCVAASGTSFAAENIVGVVIAGQPLEADVASVIADGVVSGPIADTARLAGAAVSHDPQAGTVTITRANSPRITGRIGSRAVHIGKTSQQLPRPIQLREGTVYGPLRHILGALGYRVHYREDASSLVANAIVTEMQVRGNDDAAVVTIRTSAPVHTRAEALDDPPRKYVDFAGTELGQAIPTTKYIYTGNLLRVRAGMPRTHPPVTRIVLDLVQHEDIKWVQADDRCSGTLIMGQPQQDMPVIQRHLPKLQGVAVVQSEKGAERFRAQLTWNVEPKWELDVRPPRITLTFPEVIADTEQQQFPVLGEFVSKVVVVCRQDPPRTTLQLHLKELMRFEVRNVPGSLMEVVFQREALADQRVVLDPGHGGIDTGAVGKALDEKKVNLDVALRAAQLLQQRGTTVALTRTKDRYVDLFRRAELANRWNADMFVSIHCNAMPRRNCGHGTETYFWRSISKCLGFVMQESLISGLKRRDRGLKRARFVVIRETTMPAVLVELMFLNDDREEALLQQSQTRQRAAEAIVEGLRQFVEGSESAASELETARAGGATRHANTVHGDAPAGPQKESNTHSDTRRWAQQYRPAGLQNVGRN